MSFLENLFLNYLPLAAIIAGGVWYFKRRGRENASKEQPPKAAPVKSAKPERLKLPPNRERLVALAHDLSGGDARFVKLATDMMETGVIPPDTDEDWELEFDHPSGSGPDHFGPALVQALAAETSSNQYLDMLGGKANQKRTELPTVSFDWKEDMPECCEYFDALFERLTGKTSPISEAVLALPDDTKYADKAPIVTTAFAREAFGREGYTLLEIIPPLGWDAHLFAAMPHFNGVRWKNIALRAGKDSTKKEEIITCDAYFTSAYFIEDHRPEGVTHFEGKDKEQQVGVYWFWEVKET